MARIIDGSAMNLVGKKIKKLRKQRKMTQRELSEKLELLGVYVCRGSVSRMEEVFEEVVQHVSVPVELQETLRVLRLCGGTLG